MTSVDPLEALSRAAREHEAPSAEDVRAVRSGLRERLAAAGVATATASITVATGAKASAATTLALTKGAIVASALAYFVGGTVAGGALWVTLAPSRPSSTHAAAAHAPTIASASVPPARPARATLPSEAVTPAPLATVTAAPSSKPTNTASHSAPFPREGARVAAASAPPNPVTAAPVAITTPPPPAPRDARDLSREARELAAVQQALRDGKSADALSLLQAQDSEFAGGALSVERAAARVVALCALGNGDSARDLAARFAQQHPDSPLLDRVRRSCAR